MGFLFTIILFISSLQQTVSGTVSDSRMGDRLVMVEVISSVETTYTDLDGKYTIKVVEGDSLTFKYVGYNTIKVCTEDCENVSMTY